MLLLMSKEQLSMYRYVLQFTESQVIFTIEVLSESKCYTYTHVAMGPTNEKYVGRTRRP
jgi:hypothetical protein